MSPLLLTHSNADGQAYDHENGLNIFKSLAFECRVEVIEVIYSYQY